MSLRGVTLIVAEPARLRTALEIAAAQAALGGRARIFCHGQAVAALRLDQDDPAYPAAGLPTLAELFEDAQALGVEMLACQTGLALCEMDAAALDNRIAFSGLVSVLQTLGEDRLVIA